MSTENGGGVVFFSSLSLILCKLNVYDGSNCNYCLFPLIHIFDVFIEVLYDGNISLSHFVVELPYGKANEGIGFDFNPKWSIL